MLLWGSAVDQSPEHLPLCAGRAELLVPLDISTCLTLLQEEENRDKVSKLSLEVETLPQPAWMASAVPLRALARFVLEMGIVWLSGVGISS